MANCVTTWIFLRKRFCCCLPVRLGAALLSLLTLIVGGVLMVILWFEVRTNHYMGNTERVAFILLGILETFLFVASLLGFIGACARKQSFVTAYAVFLYVHFLINVGVAGYFLWQVTSAANTDIQKLCEDAIKNGQAEGQCSGLLNIAKGVWWGVSLLVLAIEAYCALVVTRYVNQLRAEKRDVRRSRLLQRQSKIDMFHQRVASATGDSFFGAEGDHKYAELTEHDAEHGEDAEQLLQRAPEREREPENMYDPYAAYDRHAAKARRVSEPRSVRDAEVPMSPQAASVHDAPFTQQAIEMERLPSPAPVPPVARPAVTSPNLAAQRSPPPSYSGTPF